MPRHARPRPPVMPLLLGAAVGIALVVVLLVALSRVMGETPAAFEPSPAPETGPASPEALGASESCEREAVRSLSRLVTARPSSSYEGVMQLAQEKQALSPQAYAAVELTLNSVQIQFAQQGGTGLAQIITAHRPQIRRACQHAGRY